MVDEKNETITALTNHFSTYAVFHIPTWNALMTANSNFERGKIANVDVMFVIDSSSSMKKSDPHDYRKIIAKKFVDVLVSGDRAGVVDFDHNAILLCELISNFETVKKAIDRIDSKGYAYTNIWDGVRVALEQLLGYELPEPEVPVLLAVQYLLSISNKNIPIIILLTDGRGLYNVFNTLNHNLTQIAIENNVTIYTIGLGNQTNDYLLRSIAHATGGQYFHVSSTDQLPEIFRVIVEDTVRDVDTDQDGIPDIVEMKGIRDGRGYIYFTDPRLKDTDGDGLLDGEEVGVLLFSDDIGDAEVTEDFENSENSFEYFIVISDRQRWIPMKMELMTRKRSF